MSHTEAPHSVFWVWMVHGSIFALKHGEEKETMEIKREKEFPQLLFGKKKKM